MKASILVFALLGTLAGCARPAPSAPPPEKITGNDIQCRQGLVVSISALASETGRDILAEGGNAVDAAVATALALCVTYPAAGNIGGGGFMLVHPAPGQGGPVVFNYREAAPAAATRDMFGPQDSQYEHKAVAVPGTVRGLAAAHARFGRLPWARLVAPAVKLAREGFAIDTWLAFSLNKYLADKNTPGHDEFLRVFGRPGGGDWRQGDKLVQPDLARTLETLGREGPESFYSGSIARQLLAEMRRGGGLLSAADLAAYRCAVVQPLHTKYRGRFDVYLPPPPSGGGLCLLEMLNTVQNFELKSWGRWDLRTLQVMAEAMRRANCDRARFLGDPDFVRIPPELATPEHGRKLAAEIDLAKATPSQDLAPGVFISDGQDTTHFSIIDKDGLAVSNTYTIERLWGSRIVVKDAGFLLNNNMFGFNVKPGGVDAQGKIGTEPNTIAPGKRPLSSQSPCIVSEKGRVRLVIGSPGSRAIPATLLGILVNVLDFDMPVSEAVRAPRMSHEWHPDALVVENIDSFPHVEQLRKMGHKVVPKDGIPTQGDAHCLEATTSGYRGAADLRRNPDAAAAGY
ncbi:MAG: hypothetical protein RL095_834 [Verrucomicrobiota bacterium]|jgi:gamma-glutamyltranspeptidase/glutathione hydrolase